MAFSHANFGCADLKRCVAFYDVLLAPLGLRRYAINDDGQAKYTRGGKGFTAGGRGEVFFIGAPFDGRKVSPARGSRIILAAPDQAAVDGFIDAAAALGAVRQDVPAPDAWATCALSGCAVMDPGGNVIGVNLTERVRPLSAGGPGTDMQERSTMFSHITLGTNDLEKAAVFYDSVLAPLGMERRYNAPEHGLVGYGEKGGKPQVFICTPFDEGRATHGNGTHIALLAPSRDAVDCFHVAALAAGGSDEGAPGLRPQYHEHYYGAYVRDPDGNKLQACCHDPE